MSGVLNGFHVEVTAFQISMIKKTLSYLLKWTLGIEDICGHAIKKLIERAYNKYEQQEYQILANISVSHLYNLRHGTSY